MEQVDILIAGGGIAGMAAAAGFGHAGFSVLCIDPAPPVTEEAGEGADLRSTAFLQPARRYLEEAGLWPRLVPHATELATMRIVDAGGETSEPRRVRDFQSDDISDQPFGWNLPNWLLRREFSAALEGMANVEMRTGTGVAGGLFRSTGARITLSDGNRVAARLVIAADGRASPTRAAAGIGVDTTRFGQKALAFAVTHPIPHDNVSTEVHRSGGPFTLVPLPDRDGRPASAVVWMEDGPRAEDLAAMAVADFEAAMLDRSCGLFGPLTLVTRRSLWPIIAQKARGLTAPHLALVAEAAHVVPPIGAQGLNMSLADIATLRDLAVAAPDRLGEAAMLDAYARARMPDIALRVAGITALNRMSQAGQPVMQDLRGLGIDLLHGIKPVRTTLMRLGLGASA